MSAEIALERDRPAGAADATDDPAAHPGVDRATPRPRAEGRRAVEPMGPLGIAAAVLVVGAVGLGVGLLFGLGHEHLGTNVVMVAAGAAGSALLLAAATRFWVVVVGLFAVRSSLDALKLSSYASGSAALDPGVVVGLVFLLTGSLWVVAQWRARTLQPLSTPTKWAVFLAIASVLSAFGSADPISSGQVALKVVAGVLMLVVLEQAYRQRPERGLQVLVAGGLSLVVPALVALRQLTGPQELEQYLEVSRIRGTFVHPNPFATYLVILAVVAVAVRPQLHRWARRAAGCVALVATALTLFTYARGAWIALILGLLVIGACQDRRLLGALLAGVLAVVIFVPSVTARLSDLGAERQVGAGDPNSFAWRVSYWGELLPMTAENPLTGIGLDQVLARSPDRLMPHNSFVQALVETGLLGFTALAGLCLSTAIALARAIRSTEPGLPRSLAIGAAAAGLGWFVQLGSENLLTQAAIYWYLGAPLAWVLADQARRRAAAATTTPSAGGAPPGLETHRAGPRPDPAHEPAATATGA